ncbi:hypothetical protein N7493_004638 [Penicillium malachiteum]|uniref:Uncharacterized protein n=1 Tax=Penicillium malachiteum TaxID=1324776 RepID=A0AAD6MX78_9EURO|nr:hypothetical protein N7493_004638 [Penicillium malachiteum]
MSSFLRISSRIRAPVSCIPLTCPAISQRCYVHDTPRKFGQANDHDQDQREDCGRGNTPNHPIPSNNAHPTLRDGRQSNLSDMEGKPEEELPEDVRKHNEEMAQRYDRPYNHIADEGTVEKTFQKK